MTQKNRLRKVKLRELSVVTRGANQRADVLLLKQAPSRALLFKDAERLFSAVDDSNHR